ncbi:MAG: hypothetical protein ACI4GD_08960 [Lachnospiraceae bacterium]
MFKINEICYIENDKGNITPCLFKGYINEKLCFVKPKERFRKGGYGTTITALICNVFGKDEICQ